jgi:predicted RNase H-like HicB family nuclease
VSILCLIQEKESVSVPVVVEFLEEDGVYMVSVPWLQGCRAWGDTLDGALRAIPDNIRAMLEARHARADPLPEPLQNLDLSHPFTLRVSVPRH